MPPKGYFAKLQKLFDKYDMLFIADEVITGFGRTGHWFATGGMSLKPDIVTLAKGITSAYFPVSASVISEKVWNVLKDASPEFGPVMHGFTYSGHPVGASGLRMMFEAWLQLRGEAPEDRRISTWPQRDLALTHNLGGYPGEMVSFISILGSALG